MRLLGIYCCVKQVNYYAFFVGKNIRGRWYILRLKKINKKPGNSEFELEVLVYLIYSIKYVFLGSIH